jgi:Cytochrome c3
VIVPARFWGGVLLGSLALMSIAAKEAAGRDPLAGSHNCANCHQREYGSQISTSMAHAMEPVADCSILDEHKILTFREDIYSYRIERQGNQSVYTVTDGKSTITVRLQYAFGLGKAGQTYVFEREGKMYESRVSFYRAINGLDWTMGARNYRPGNLEEAAGRMMSRVDAQQCFGCHTTSVLRNAFRMPEALTPGVTCEHCHGSAVAHVEGFRQGRPVAMKRLSQLSTEELSDFCGQCHRTWATIAEDGPHDINNVRFQPYRLANSKCYDPSDKRISCIACHNVHEEVVGADSLYDRRCLACHATSRAPAKPAAKSCPVGTNNCVTCHMPKLELPGSHYKFTDHRIRIAKADTAYRP